MAEELWEVKGRKIKNLTREDITIVDYKKMLVKNSTCLLDVTVRSALIRSPGQAALEKAKLFSKTARHTKT